MTQLKPQISDAQLIQKCKSGDQMSFGVLVERYQTTAFRFAFRLACESTDAEDLCQTAFIRIWNYRERIKPQSRFSTLLYTVLSRLWIDQLRMQKRRLFTRTINMLDDLIVDGEPSPEMLTLNEDLARRIRKFGQKLPPRQRLVFTLRDLEDLNISEVVQITGLSKASVKTNLSIARQKIRKQLQTITG